MGRMESTTPRSGASRTWALIAICTGYFVVILDTTVVNVALLSLERSLGTGVTGAQWVVDAYSAVLARLLVSAGAISGRSEPGRSSSPACSSSSSPRSLAGWLGRGQRRQLGGALAWRCSAA